MSKLQSGLIALIALVIGVVMAIYISPPGAVNKTQHVSLYPQVRALPDFQLVDHKNKTFTAEDLRGYWSLVFVGYTFCPDICPTTMAELKGIYPELQKIPSDFPVQIVLLSVDPKRDTPERLNEYINFFHSDFIGVSGESSVISISQGNGYDVFHV
jgi:protein SCO1/2